MTFAHGAPRHRGAAVAALLAALGACASAQPPTAVAQPPGTVLAGGWSQPLEVPAASEGRPRLLAAGRDGGRIVVWSTDPVYEGSGA